MPYMMMDYLPTILFIAFVATMILLLAAGVAFAVWHFRDIHRNPDKYRPCADTLPCGDRIPTK